MGFELSVTFPVGTIFFLTLLATLEQPTNVGATNNQPNIGWEIIIFFKFIFFMHIALAHPKSINNQPTQTSADHHPTKNQPKINQPKNPPTKNQPIINLKSTQPKINVKSTKKKIPPTKNQPQINPTKNQPKTNQPKKSAKLTF